METVASSSSDIPSTSDISVSPPLKKRRLQMSEEIDLNECCMCFGTYEDDIMEGAGAEWISCACGRWLHKDCAESRVIDSSGCESLLQGVVTHIQSVLPPATAVKNLDRLKCRFHP